MSREFVALLKTSRTAVLQQWQQRVAKMVEVMHLSRIELLDHMPAFVDSLIESMESQHRLGTEPEDFPSAGADHGTQRLAVGFDVDEVAREYGILADVFLDALGPSLSADAMSDVRALLAAVNAGAAGAIREYVRERDEQLHRAQARHRAFIAHELRTPLSNAVARAVLLERLKPALAEEPSMVSLQRSLAHLRELIDQVLLAGALDAGVEPNRTDADLAQVLAEVAEGLRAEAEDLRVALKVESPAELPAKIDLVLVQSAITNLLRNAVKYTRPETTVRVALRAIDDNAVLEVFDQCGGITASNWTSFFEPFERGNDPKTQKRDGLGLGLAIAKQAVESHGGRLSVRNVPGQGCIFEIRIPLDGQR
jgi:signal transduction histidine kinase